MRRSIRIRRAATIVVAFIAVTLAAPRAATADAGDRVSAAAGEEWIDAWSEVWADLWVDAADQSADDRVGEAQAVAERAETHAEEEDAPVRPQVRRFPAETPLTQVAASTKTVEGPTETVAARAPKAGLGAERLADVAAAVAVVAENEVIAVNEVVVAADDVVAPDASVETRRAYVGTPADASLAEELTEADGDPPLVPGDAIDVSFLENPELSRIRTIEADGTLSFPGGERVRIAGLRLADAEAEVRTALKGGALGRSTVSLAIAERVPVVVLGDVRAPGEYPFVAGMRVLRAIGMAGGYGARASARSNRSDELANEYADAAALLTQINALKARLARLTAEQAGQSYTAPETATPLSFSRFEEDVARLREAERSAQLRVLRDQIAPINEKISLVQRTIRSQTEAYEIFQDRVAKIQSLVEKRLSTSNALTDLQLTLSRMESDVLEQRSELATAKQDRLRLQREIDRIAAGARLEASVERREAIEELAVLYERLRFATLAVGPIASQEPAGAIFDEAPIITHVLTIVRNGADGVQELPVSERSVVRPGDVVRVESLLLDRSIDDVLQQ